MAEIIQVRLGRARTSYFALMMDAITHMRRRFEGTENRLLTFFSAFGLSGVDGSIDHGFHGGGIEMRDESTYMISIALVLLLSVSGPTTAPSASPSPIAAPTSADDVRALRDAVRDEMAGKRDHIALTFDQKQYLPAFDNLIHYIGTTTDRQIQITASYDYVQTHQSVITAFSSANVEMVQAFVLGTMDIGAAGAKWKAYYDSLAQADAVLPTSVSDRYENRHQAATALATAILALP